MPELINIALVAWFPLAVLLFCKLPSRRALIGGVVGAMMFLPMGAIEVPLIPGRKDVVCSVGLLLAGLLVDPYPLLALRPRWLDFPMILLCVSPFIAATTNGLDPRIAFSASTATFVTWGLPYFLGRAYLTDFDAARDMAWAIFIGGLLYIPGCLFEMVLSPTLHQRVYGVPAFADFMQSVRLGGYRPVMFMQHGLMVGTFMCAGAVIGVWMVANRAARPVFGFPAWMAAGCQFVVAVACKSTGAILLMCVAFGVLSLSRFARSSVLVYALVLAAPAYILGRTIGGWDGKNAVRTANEFLSLDHGGSLEVRFENENVLIERGMRKPLFGWGPNGDFLVKDDHGRVTSIPDGLWMIAFGSGGLVALAALFGAFLLPTVALVRRFPPHTWHQPAMAAPAALAVFLPTYAIDSLMNAMLNPMWMVSLGAIGSLALGRAALVTPGSLAAGLEVYRRPRLPRDPLLGHPIPKRPALPAADRPRLLLTAAPSDRSDVR